MAGLEKQPLLDGVEAPAPAPDVDLALAHSLDADEKRGAALAAAVRADRAARRCGGGGSLTSLRRNQMHIYVSLLFVYLAFMVYEVNYSYFVLYDIENGDTGKAANVTTLAYIAFTVCNMIAAAVFGALSDAIGRVPVYAFSYGQLGAIVVTLALFPTKVMFIGLTGLSGLLDGSGPAVSALIVDQSRLNQRGERRNQKAAALAAAAAAAAAESAAASGGAGDAVVVPPSGSADAAIVQVVKLALGGGGDDDDDAAGGGGGGARRPPRGGRARPNTALGGGASAAIARRLTGDFSTMYVFVGAGCVVGIGVGVTAASFTSYAFGVFLAGCLCVSAAGYASLAIDETLPPKQRLDLVEAFQSIRALFGGGGGDDDAAAAGDDDDGGAEQRAGGDGDGDDGAAAGGCCGGGCCCCPRRGAESAAEAAQRTRRRATCALIGVYALVSAVWGGFCSIGMYYLQFRFAPPAPELGALMLTVLVSAACGIVLANAWLMRHMRERGTISLALCAVATALGGLGNATAIWQVFALAALGGTGFGAAPVLNAALARLVPSREQGRIQGIKYVMSTAGSVIGALAFDTMYSLTYCDQYVNGSEGARMGCMRAGLPWWVAATILYLTAAMCAAFLPSEFESFSPPVKGKGAAGEEEGAGASGGGGDGSDGSDDDDDDDDDDKSRDVERGGSGDVCKPSPAVAAAPPRGGAARAAKRLTEAPAPPAASASASSAQQQAAADALEA